MCKRGWMKKDQKVWTFSYRCR